MWLLKSQDQNLIVIHHKINDNFKSYINFRKTKKRIPNTARLQNVLQINSGKTKY
jgi:hypothetical protein